MDVIGAASASEPAGSSAGELVSGLSSGAASASQSVGSSTGEPGAGHSSSEFGFPIYHPPPSPEESFVLLFLSITR